MAAYSIKAGDVVLTPDKGPEEAKTVWDVKWNIREIKDEKRYVGCLWFKGEPTVGVVEMQFEIEPRFRQNEYTRDVLRAIVDWVFAKKNLYEIKITVKVEEEDKIDALERSGFVFRIGNKEEEHYSIMKPRTMWTGLYILIGTVAGLILGIVFNSIIGGLVAGIIIGIIIGAILDTRSNMERTAVTGEKRTIHRKAVYETVSAEEYENSGIKTGKNKESEDKKTSE